MLLTVLSMRKPINLYVSRQTSKIFFKMETIGDKHRKEIRRRVSWSLDKNIRKVKR